MNFIKINKAEQIDSIKTGNVLLQYPKKYLYIPEKLNSDEAGEKYIVKNIERGSFTIVAIPKNGIGNIYSDQKPGMDFINEKNWFILA